MSREYTQGVTSETSPFPDPGSTRASPPSPLLTWSRPAAFRTAPSSEPSADSCDDSGSVLSAQLGGGSQSGMFAEEMSLDEVRGPVGAIIFRALPVTLSLSWVFS